LLRADECSGLAYNLALLDYCAGKTLLFSLAASFYSQNKDLGIYPSSLCDLTDAEKVN